jgi:hypothetical protein
MTDLEEIWSRRTDEQLSEALASLTDFSDEGQAVIRSECLRRGIERPVRRTVTDQDVVDVVRSYQWYVRCVVAQWVIVATFLVVPQLFRGEVGSFLVLVLLLVLVATSIALPKLGRRLLVQLGDEAPGRTTVFLSWPLFAALTLAGLRPMVQKWRRLHGIEL